MTTEARILAAIDPATPTAAMSALWSILARMHGAVHGARGSNAEGMLRDWMDKAQASVPLAHAEHQALSRIRRAP